MGKRRRIDAVKTEFAEAAERHLDDVHAYLVYLTGDRGTAEELAAETFARACERWHRFDPSLGLEALRELIASLGAGEGVEVAGDVGVTSHAGDLLRRAAVPSRLVGAREG